MLVGFPAARCYSGAEGQRRDVTDAACPPPRIRIEEERRP